jgi:hypothetical protein
LIPKEATMEPEDFRGPRDASPEATAAEADAWAERERRRRAAWLAGPDEEEKLAWVRRYRRRAALGLEESRLGPNREEAEAWAERERRRRVEWSEGPGEAEKREWAARQRIRSFAGLAESRLPPSSEEIDSWARAESAKRKAWLSGPADEEKREWSQRSGWASAWTNASGDEPSYADLAARFLREAELAGKGSLWTLASAPAAIWSHFVKAGRRFERDMSGPPRRGRVPY